MKNFAVAVALVAILGGSAFASEIVEGEMVFKAKNGDVHFSHKKHTQRVDDCKTCHEQTGAIVGFGKAYAHDKCIGCHQPQGDEKEPVGPVKCAECHGGSRG